MLFKTKYDLIFSIGEACSCSRLLRKCRLQFYSYPFDWLFGADILTRVKILTDNYNNFINYEDLEDTGTNNAIPKHLCEIYRNKKNGIHFNHDFPFGLPLSDIYMQVKEKYERRANRQIKQIEKSKNILVVYLQPPTNSVLVDDKTLSEVHSLLKNRFPNQHIDLFYLYCEHDKEFSYPEISNNGIYKANFDYDAYDKNFAYEVNYKILQKIFGKLKISQKFISPKNRLRRLIYLFKALIRGVLW